MPWDSGFWGFPVARVVGQSLSAERAADIDRWSESNAIVCLYFLSGFNDPETIRVAEHAAFQLVDARVTFKQAIGPDRDSGGAYPSAATLIRPAHNSDIARLQQIAGVCHRDTRFYFDGHFPRPGCQELYEHWIAASCSGYAEQVLVAASGNAPVGYVSCHLPTDGNAIGRIGLIGVSPDMRGSGIGRALVQSAIMWFAQQGVESVEVATQGRNTAAQSLYQRCGFITNSLELWYHKWYSVPRRGGS